MTWLFQNETVQFYSGAYLDEFYGDSAGAFAIYVFTFCLIGSLINAFVIGLTLTAKNLRNKAGNQYLMGLGLADFNINAAYLFDSYTIWTGQTESAPHIRHQGCSIAGYFIMTMAATGWFASWVVTVNFEKHTGFPPMIAAHRYYLISNVPGNAGQGGHQSRSSFGVWMFAETMAVKVIVFWFFMMLGISLPLYFLDYFGEDPTGFCGARPGTTSIGIFVYRVGIIGFFFVGLGITAVYYTKLHQWLQAHRQRNIGDREAMKRDEQTKSLMHLMKVVTIIPTVFSAAAATQVALNGLLPVLPMWLNRVLFAPHLWSHMTSPILTLLLIKPFKARFMLLIGRVNNARKTTITTSAVLSVSNNNNNNNGVSSRKISDARSPSRSTMMVMTSQLK